MNLKDFRNKMKYLESIDKSWTLFLDRDGVVNTRLIDDYVKNWEEFEFIPGVLEALKRCSDFFGKIILVTNQQGIGKGLMTEKDLKLIHAKMLDQIKAMHGRIDLILFSPDLAASGSEYRKPGIGMALKARKQFPEINFKKSVMVGDTLNDMKFGKKLKMLNVLISNEKEIPDTYPGLVDICFENLYEFSLAVK